MANIHIVLKQTHGNTGIDRAFSTRAKAEEYIGEQIAAYETLGWEAKHYISMKRGDHFHSFRKAGDIEVLWISTAPVE